MRRILAPTAAVVAVLILWWATVSLLSIDPFLLPGPADVVAAFTEQWRYLARQTAVTSWQTLGGFALAAAGAAATAVLLAASRWAREALLPLLVAVQAVPKVALAPLLLVWLGFGPSSKITLVVLLCYFPIVINMLSGLTSTPAELVELTRSLAAGRWRTFTRIRIPWALPETFTGLKVAISLALIGAVVAQITTPNEGLGAVIVRAGQATNTALQFAAITLLAAIGIVLFYGLVAAERLLLPWARETTA